MYTVIEHKFTKYNVIELLNKLLLSTVLCSDVSDRGGDPGPGRLKARLLPTVT